MKRYFDERKFLENFFGHPTPSEIQLCYMKEGRGGSFLDERALQDFFVREIDAFGEPTEPFSPAVFEKFWRLVCDIVKRYKAPWRERQVKEDDEVNLCRLYAFIGSARFVVDPRAVLFLRAALQTDNYALFPLDVGRPCFCYEKEEARNGERKPLAETLQLRTGFSREHGKGFRRIIGDTALWDIIINKKMPTLEPTHPYFSISLPWALFFFSQQGFNRDAFWARLKLYQGLNVEKHAKTTVGVHLDWHYRIFLFDGSAKESRAYKQWRHRRWSEEQNFGIWPIRAFQERIFWLRTKRRLARALLEIAGWLSQAPSDEECDKLIKEIFGCNPYEEIEGGKDSNK